MRFLIKIGCLQGHLSNFDGKYENFEFEIFCEFISRIGGAHMSKVLMMYEFMTNKILYLQFSK